MIVPTDEEMEGLLQSLPPKERDALLRKTMPGMSKIKFIPNAGPQTEAYFSKADVLLFGGNPGGGKALYINELVPVPLKTDASGFKKHGDLVRGDFVFSPEGSETQVILVSTIYDGPGYEIEFDTGEKVIASAEHIWNTWTRKDRDRLLRATPEWRSRRRQNRPSRGKANPLKPGTSAAAKINNSLREYDIIEAHSSNKRTEDIYNTLYVEGKRLNHSIPVAEAFAGEKLDLPVDPYLFGLWLGDGFTNAPYIVMLTDDWFQIESNISEKFTVGLVAAKENRRELQMRRFPSIRNGLKHLDVLGRKRIPPLYLRASLEQRRDLLRGILDTDGTCDKRGQIEVGFSDLLLANDLFDLVSSLGLKTTLREKEAKDQHGNGQTHYRVKFLAPFPAFKMQRKLFRQKLVDHRKTVSHRYIKNMVPISGIPMRCITVRNPGGMYLATRSFIPTHNTALEIGLAMNCHHRSLIVRSQFSDLEGLLDNAKRIIGTTDGFIGGARPKYRKEDGGVIHFEGLPEDGGIGGKQGVDHDLVCVDEAATVPENQVRLLMGWLRSDRPGQRCRMVLASNPPLDSTGDWLITYFAPWLDPTYPRPAKNGELRYFLPDEETGKDRECDADDWIMIHDVKVYAQSRTFIPSKFTDNPYYSAEEYAKSLSGLPEEIRNILVSGNFMLSRSDSLWQCIPTSVVRAAQQRWTAHPPAGTPMCSIGVDIAQGGPDKTVLARRHDGWYDKLVTVSGKLTPEGSDVAALIIKHRRDAATIILDMGGGWGGLTASCLKNNEIKTTSYKGVMSSNSRDKSGNLGFTNVRSQAYWQFREALDPDQPGGSTICLPDDPELVAELTAPTFRTIRQGGRMCIQLQEKDAVMKSLGRSTDKADAVVMAWYDGVKGIAKNQIYSKEHGGDIPYGGKHVPKINLGRDNARRGR